MSQTLEDLEDDASASDYVEDEEERENLQPAGPPYHTHRICSSCHQAHYADVNHGRCVCLHAKEYHSSAVEAQASTCCACITPLESEPFSVTKLGKRLEKVLQTQNTGPSGRQRRPSPGSAQELSSVGFYLPEVPCPSPAPAGRKGGHRGRTRRRMVSGCSDSAPLSSFLPAAASRPGDEHVIPAVADKTPDVMVHGGNFWDYLVRSCRRDPGQRDEDKERMAEKRRRVQTFLSVPFEVEKVMCLGTIQCADAFLYVFTIFPIRLCVACWHVLLLVGRLLAVVCRVSGRLRWPADGWQARGLYPTTCICEMIKGSFILLGVWAFTWLDLSVMYHFLRGQAVVKLYIMFNMLEVADRLCSSFGQDILESLFWTASPAGKVRPAYKTISQLGIIPQIITALLYVMVHSLVVLVQITTLNIAMNSQNRALLVILLSNNFVEIKGSVFKKFEKKNLYQISCSDVRERFQFIILLLMVVIRNMTELGWKMDNFWACLPDALLILVAEVVVDWTKHAFITKFNEISMSVYQDYTYSLAYDFAASHLDNNKFADQSDSVVRRMGFVPIPLAIIVIRIVYQSFRFDDVRDWLLLGLGYVCLFTTKLLINVRLLRWCYNLIIEHRGKHRAERRCHSTPGTRAGSISSRVDVTERAARSAPSTPPPPTARRPRPPPRAPSVGQTPLLAGSQLDLTLLHEHHPAPIPLSRAESRAEGEKEIAERIPGPVC